MNGVRVSRFLFIGFSALTLLVMIWVLGPFGTHKDSGSMMVSLLLSPLLLVWGIGPYAVAHRFAAEDEGRGAWLFVAIQLIAGVVIMALYAEAFAISPDPNVNVPLAFAIMPIYQFVGVLIGYYVLRVWRRSGPPQ
jgi:hypothetical protein